MKRFIWTFVVVQLVACSSRAAEDPEAISARCQTVLAQLEGEIHVAGLKQPVEVLRDRWGVPHIYAKNTQDLFFSQGFVAAQDRLFQIDMWRRVAVGETAEVLGPAALVRDHFARLTRYRGNMQREWTSYAPDAQQIVTAFTQGINAYIDLLGDRLPIEFEILGYRPKKWQPADCLGRTSVLAVAFNLRTEIARAELVAAVGVEQARQAMPTDPKIDFAPADGLDLAGINESILAGYKAVTAPPLIQPETGGSNNWAVDGTLSASGKPLLASDPHRAITLPSLRYLVHLNAPGWNVIGGGEPALPGVAIGHNERIAWGFTVVLTDQADLVVEETNPADPNQYRVACGWQPLEIVREVVMVKQGDRLETQDRELRFTRHGPIIHEDRKRNRAYALRWVGSEPGTAAYLGSLAIDRASNWEEFLRAVDGWKTPSENLVYADVDGNIGWIAAALTPIRRHANGLLPVPGASGRFTWQGFLPTSELPQSYNPAAHYLVTANHNILPPGYPHEIAFDWSASYRFERLKQLLEAKRSFTLDDFQRMQYDEVSLPSKQLVQLLARLEICDPDLAPYVKRLTAWDGSLTKQSQSGSLYVVWHSELTRAFFGLKVPQHLVEAVADRSGIPMMIDELSRPTTAWFGEDPTTKRDQLIRETLRRAVEKTTNALGEDVESWRLGSLQQMLFKHPLSGRSSVYAKLFNVGPMPSGSGPYAPNQARYDKNHFREHGATYRHVLDLADWDRGMATSAPGQSGQPGSPYYADLAPIWDSASYFPLAFSRQYVEEVTRYRLVLKPSN